MLKKILLLLTLTFSVISASPSKAYIYPFFHNGSMTEAMIQDMTKKIKNYKNVIFVTEGRPSGEEFKKQDHIQFKGGPNMKSFFKFMFENGRVIGGDDENLYIKNMAATQAFIANKTCKNAINALTFVLKRTASLVDTIDITLLENPSDTLILGSMGISHFIKKSSYENIELIWLQEPYNPIRDYIEENCQ